MPPFFVGNKGIILLLSKMGKGGFGMSGVKGCGGYARERRRERGGFCVCVHGSRASKRFWLLFYTDETALICAVHGA